MSWSPEQEVQEIIQSTALACLHQKCNSFRSSKIQYISPQELIQRLPPSLNIERKHITTVRGGQWEIKNRNIHCYVSFQVTASDDTKRVLRRLVAERAQSQQYGYKSHSNKYQKEKDCHLCRRRAVIFGGTGKHFCRVKGYFTCDRHKNPHSFTVGICLLDPNTETPPTGYACQYCSYFATFDGYEIYSDLKEDDAQSGGDYRRDHRQDLCEACGIWGDCRNPSVQPSVIYEALRLLKTKCRWYSNDYGDGVVCDFNLLEYDEEYNIDDVYHIFEVRPYVNCVFVDQNRFYDKRQKFRSNQKRNERRQNIRSNLKKKNPKRTSKRSPYF